jgi:SAM-dependent methyltransferase
VGHGEPHPFLVERSTGLPRGRALEAGCGDGADAVRLATDGWEVTAVDVSATGLAGARALAADAGVAEGIVWVHADLAGWNPADAFDLVTSHYVHPPGPVEDLVARLGSWVAPGGTLLVVGHADQPSPGHGSEPHAHPPGSLLPLDRATAALPADRWEVDVAEHRTRRRHPPGSGHAVEMRDAVLAARRRTGGRPDRNHDGGPGVAGP